MQLDKSFITNTIAVLFVALSYGTTQYHNPLLYTGLFALSGALTNQLAIHMLFEKVPWLYGSGVIENNFQSFKISIKNLMMEQFFTKEQLQNFFASEEKKINLAPIIQETDFTPAFDALAKTVMESQFGGMLGMFGGEVALESLKEPFTNKMKTTIITIVNSETFNTTMQKHLQNSTVSDDLLHSIENIIDTRLNQLTPKIVKEMVQQLIQEHLGWLVVWGGVFGGLIGLVSSFLV